MAGKQGAAREVKISVPGTDTKVITPPAEKEHFRLGCTEYFMLLESIASACIAGLLIASLTVDRLKSRMIAGLELWKWCVLLFVILCSRLVTCLVINVSVLLVDRKLFTDMKLAYIVYGIKKSIQLFIWLTLVLVAWVCLFKLGAKRHDDHHSNRAVNLVTRALLGFLVGSAIWLGKSFLVVQLAVSYHGNKFFDKVRESVFLHKIFTTLVNQSDQGAGNKKSGVEKSIGRIINMVTLFKMQWEVSDRTINQLFDQITGHDTASKSNNMPYGKDKQNEEEMIKKKLKQGALKILTILSDDSGHMSTTQIKQKLEKYDFSIWKDSDFNKLYSRLHDMEFEGEIDQRIFMSWMESTYHTRKLLARRLSDSKTAVGELNMMANGVALVIVIIAWLLVMGWVTSTVLLGIFSQLLVLNFMFGDSTKTTFEAIIFVFVMHPFDVDDHCVVEKETLAVDDMNILTTIFRNSEGRKLYYPNSVLSTKTIYNLNRSPEELNESLEFEVDLSDILLRKIEVLKERIIDYLEKHRSIWQPKHSMVVKSTGDTSKFKLCVNVKHAVGFENSDHMRKDTGELVSKIMGLMEKLDINNDDHNHPSSTNAAA